MDQSPLRVAAIGIGWWSDVLADAVQALGQAQDHQLLYAGGGKA